MCVEMCIDKIIKWLCCMFISGIILYASYQVIKKDYLGM